MVEAAQEVVEEQAVVLVEDDDDEASGAVTTLTVEELRRLLEELASTRPDVQAPAVRQARLQSAVEALKQPSPDGGEGARQLLASLGVGAYLY